MREILFRGRRVDNGELIISDSIMQIKGQNPRLWVEFDGWVEVIPETVGQFTGLTDKNGKKVFEGDIIKTQSIIGKNIYEVRFSEKRRGWFPFACGDGCGCCEDEVECPEDVKIIGNIYDNKEILEDKE